MSIYVSAIDGMTSHDAADVTRLETAFLSQEGVVGITANDLKVEAQSSPDMSVKVNAGSCFVLRDSFNSNDNTLKFWHVIVTATTNVTITTSDPSNPRIDLICVKVDTAASPDVNASNVATLVAVAGTPAGSPARPSVPSNHLELAQVAVGAGVTTITSGNITDNRVFVGFALPYNEGYRYRDTQGNLDGRTYEDSSGRVVVKSEKSGGEIIVDPLLNKIQMKASGGSAKQTLSGESALEFLIDGGAIPITTGQKGHLEVPFDCEVQGWTIMADQSGSIVVDVWRDSYANFPPTVNDSIAGSQKPTLSSAQKNQNTNPTSWNRNLTKGDILAFNVDSITTVTRVVISIKVNKR